MRDPSSSAHSQRASLRAGLLGALALLGLPAGPGCGAPPGSSRAASVRAAQPAAEARYVAASVAAVDGRTAVGAVRSVIVVTIDGVRWQEVFLGVDRAMALAAGLPEAEIVPPERLLPTLYGLVLRHGAGIGAPDRGAQMTASGPNFLSLPGYQEIFTGRPAVGCANNDCAAVARPTLADQFRGLAARDDEVAVISSWERIERAAALDPARVVLSTGRHGGITRDGARADAYCSELIDMGERASPMPGEDDYRPDAYTAPLALRYLALREPRFFFIGLGDPDEHAHLRNYGAYLRSLRSFDAFVGDLIRTLGALGDYGAHAAVFLTTDHGRSRDFHSHGGRFPESSRVWLMAVGAGVPARGLVASPVERHLADIAPSIRAMVGLPRDEDEGAGRPLDEILAPGAPPAGAQQLPP